MQFAKAGETLAIIMIAFPPRTSASPRAEGGRSAVSRRCIKTIWFESRNSSRWEGLNLSFLEGRFSGSGERAENGKEWKGDGQQTHLGQ